MQTGIVCACLPSLRTFAKEYFPKIFDNSDDPNSVLTGWTRSQTDLMQTQETGELRRPDFGHGNIPMDSTTDSSHSVATSGQGDHSFKSSIALIQPLKNADSIAI